MKKPLLIRLWAKLCSNTGDSNLLTSTFIGFVSIVCILGAIFFYEKVTLAMNLNQMANAMVREISLEGGRSPAVDRRLASLEKLYGISVEMKVDGNFLRNSKKFQLQSEFEVSIIYGRQEKFFLWKEDKVYVAKAKGISEQYTKEN